MEERVCIIGLGEIGGSVLLDIAASEKKKGNKIQIFGVDIDSEVVTALKKKKYNVSMEFPDACDVYIISVWTTEQVISVFERINFERKPLVVIESTIYPGTTNKLKKLVSQDKYDLVVFPHRYYAKDKTKRVFNLDRVLGGISKESTNRAIAFYSRYMPKRLIHVCDIDIAELCKVTENAIRYTEIAKAEELRFLMAKIYGPGISDAKFKQLRDMVNTKWNINLPDAWDGIGGHCLPKDVKIFNDLFPENILFKFSVEVDNLYSSWYKNRKSLERK